VTLKDFVMGQVHPGLSHVKDDPLMVDEHRVREWLRRDPQCKALLRRVITGPEIGRYHVETGGKYHLLIPPGWTSSNAKANRKPWQWFRHRHPLIARYLQPHEELLKDRAGPDSLWWETSCDEFWQEPRKKTLFPSRFSRPAFWFDAGRGIGDETISAIPSSGMYLAGILNSRLMGFVFDQGIRHSAPGRKLFSWDDLKGLPIHTPDFDQAEDRLRHDRVEKLVRRLIDLEKNCRMKGDGPEREALQKKIRATDRQIDALVYALYGLMPEEIAVVEGAVSVSKGD
jgi:hypothetical protein